MHHALILPDITCNIFEFLNPFLSGPEGSHEPNPLRLRDLAAVAITCHAFSGPALDVLWDTQVCFGPLLMCMPPSVVEVRDSGFKLDADQRHHNWDQPLLRRNIHLIKDPLPSDLLRMLPYARRIKRLGPPVTKCPSRWRLPEQFSIPFHIINWLLLAYPMEDFLPRLTHMSCPEPAPGMEDTMDISFAPLSRSNLTRFNFSITFDEDVQGWPLLSTVVSDLPQLRIITLRVEGWWQDIDMLYSGIIAPLCSFRNLEHLDITISGHVSEDPGLAGPHAFPCLQKLTLSSDYNFAAGFLTELQSPVLHTLDFTLTMQHSSGDHCESLDCHQLFSSLRRLRISSDFRFMMSLVEAVHSSVLESLSLTITNICEPDEPIARALVAQILSKRGWGSSLRSITIDRFGPDLGLDGPPGPRHPFFLSIEDLLVFSHLQHVILDGLSISLNNALCKKLAIGWPDLVELYFTAPRNVAIGDFGAPNTLPPLQSPPVKGTVDLGSLVAFARHCPKLSRLHLSIPLDTTELPVLDNETLTILSSRPTHSPCMWISISVDAAISIPAADPNAVAEFFAKVFPGREIKFILAASFCKRNACKSTSWWREVVEWLRKSQPSSLKFGPCYRTRLCGMCWHGV